MKGAEIISGQAEQDQMWMAWDDWYADSSKESLLRLIEAIEPSGRRLNRRRQRVVNNMALHMIRELALRSHSRDGDGESSE